PDISILVRIGHFYFGFTVSEIPVSEIPVDSKISSCYFIPKKNKSLLQASKIHFTSVAVDQKGLPVLFI
ncbi:MAG: hypothetical protein AABY87_09765, partial [bacterium]